MVAGKYRGKLRCAAEARILPSFPSALVRDLVHPRIHHVLVLGVRSVSTCRLASRTVQVACARAVVLVPRTYLACACIRGLVDHAAVILRVTLDTVDHFRLHLLVAVQDEVYGAVYC